MEDSEYRKYKELWDVLWRRYFNIIDVEVKVCVPKSGSRDTNMFGIRFAIRDGDKFCLSINIKIIASSIDNTYIGYNYYITYIETNEEIFRAEKYKSKTGNTFYGNIDIKPEYVEKISELLKIHNTHSYINNEIDELCRYISAFRKILDKTDYIKHISSARMFMLCSKKTFPRDISKIIYKKILFFLFLFFFLLTYNEKNKKEKTKSFCK
jgi:hypothetical protein